MKKKAYLFDTHALVFWNNNESVSERFLSFFDNQVQKGHLYVSSISFWEIALLVKKGRISMPDVHAWKNEIEETEEIFKWLKSILTGSLGFCFFIVLCLHGSCVSLLAMPSTIFLFGFVGFGKNYLDKLIADMYRFGIQKSTIQEREVCSKWQKRQ